MAIYKEEIQNQYFKTPAEYVHNSSFTLKEIGMLTLLNSLPVTWKFSLEGLTRIVNEGIDSIRATYKKLDKKGFVNAPRVRGPDGKFACSDLFMYISPEPENDPDAENPHMVNPMTDKPPVDKTSPGRPRAGYRRESMSKESIIKESKKKGSMNQGYNVSRRGRKFLYCLLRKQSPFAIINFCNGLFLCAVRRRKESKHGEESQRKRLRQGHLPEKGWFISRPVCR